VKSSTRKPDIGAPSSAAIARRIGLRSTETSGSRCTAAPWGERASHRLSARRRCHRREHSSSMSRRALAERGADDARWRRPEDQVCATTHRDATVVCVGAHPSVGGAPEARAARTHAGRASPGPVVALAAHCRGDVTAIESSLGGDPAQACNAGGGERNGDARGRVGSVEAVRQPVSP
jgi:hypothetical protein